MHKCNDGFLSRCCNPILVFKIKYNLKKCKLLIVKLIIQCIIKHMFYLYYETIIWDCRFNTGFSFSMHDSTGWGWKSVMSLKAAENIHFFQL